MQKNHLMYVLEDSSWVFKSPLTTEVTKKSKDISLFKMLLWFAILKYCMCVQWQLDGLSGFALRDQSAECLNILIEQVASETRDGSSSELFRVVIVRHLLSELKSNIRLKSEVTISFVVLLILLMT